MKKPIKSHRAAKTALFTGATMLAALVPQTRGESSVDSLLNKLEQKGVLTVDEANQLKAENAAEETNIVNQLPASKWKLADSIKNMSLYGDLRFRYEYRGVGNAPGLSPNTYYR